MSIITSNKTRSEYDVIVVGSGAAGGTSAYVLAMEGVRVCIRFQSSEGVVTHSQWDSWNFVRLISEQAACRDRRERMQSQCAYSRQFGEFTSFHLIVLTH